MIGVLLVRRNQYRLPGADVQIVQETKQLHPHFLCEGIEVLFNLRVKHSWYQVWVVIVELGSVLDIF